MSVLLIVFEEKLVSAHIKREQVISKKALSVKSQNKLKIMSPVQINSALGPSSNNPEP